MGRQQIGKTSEKIEQRTRDREYRSERRAWGREPGRMHNRTHPKMAKMQEDTREILRADPSEICL